jgi:hypothetical protein
VRIRLHGTEDECTAAARLIAQVLPVVSVSDPYPDRGASVLCRMYLETRMPERSAGPVSGALPS